MKKNILSWAFITAIVLVSCEDDTADIIINNNNGGTTTGSTETVFLSGTKSENLTLNKNTEYIIDGPLIMSEGTTLTIPAGTTVKASASGAEVYIAITQGAKIDARGTADAPIVLTSNAASPKAGDWGGLILLGKAPINSVADANTTATSEIGSLPYGGSNASDNSGILQYVRVEYSGGKADGQSENNGFSFYGVGNGTTVEFIQAYEGLDDGVEFFGGTVNASNVSVVNVEDDSVDWTEGYTGTLTDVYIKQNAKGDKAFECDGYNTDIGNNSNPIFVSSPTVTNITVIGDSSATQEAVRLRAGTAGIFTNMVLTDYNEGFDLDFDSNGNANTEITGQNVVNGKLKANQVLLNNVTLAVKNDTGVAFAESDFLTEDANATGTDYASWGSGWTK
ncbi:MAG: multidrug transporter [Flavobacteriales bacterium]